MLKRFSCGIDEPQWNRIEPSNLFLISWRSWRPWRLDCFVPGSISVSNQRESSRQERQESPRNSEAKKVVINAEGFLVRDRF
jgi:hypothetical protein